MKIKKYIYTYLLIAMSTYAHAEDLDKLIWTCEHYENDGTYCYKAGDAYFAIHDYGQAKTYYEKSCNRKDFFSWGCIGLGRLYEDTKNYDQAKIYYEKACNSQPWGCIELGRLHKENQNYSLAKIYYEKACNYDPDYGYGCFLLGDLYWYGNGVKKDYSKGKTFYEKACKLNDGFGCLRLGFIYGVGEHAVEKNMSTSKEYYCKSCDLGMQGGCDNCIKLTDKGY